MAITKEQDQVKWSASNSTSVSAGSNDTSDEVAIHDTAIGGRVVVKADNAGTPAAGDVLFIKILYEIGDHARCFQFSGGGSA